MFHLKVFPRPLPSRCNLRIWSHSFFLPMTIKISRNPESLWNCWKRITLLRGCFSGFLNCTNGTKSRNASFSWQKCEVEVNPFPASIPVLYPLKTLENLWFSGVFRGYKFGTLAGNGLILTIINNIFVFARVVHCLKEERW